MSQLCHRFHKTAVDYKVLMKNIRFDTFIWLFMSWTNSSPPGQNGRHFADDIFECIFMNENSVFWFEFHFSLILRILFRLWLGFKHATIHYLKQCWPSSLTRGRWVNSCQLISVSKRRLKWLGFIYFHSIENSQQIWLVLPKLSRKHFSSSDNS